ncbi:MULTISPECIES: RNA polymerase sigma factor [unclassified Fibrobacter]|uniref:RNA polymerase sigma factor n=1 Tax=unclassified Fibrobacter TaxID=2634177 RepID=UPI000D6B5D9E|nr:MULTISPECIES: sigma-70 family RNA polymerase sigma factor [unclassified Fibrobacter]
MVESTIVKKLKDGSREALALLWQDHSKNVLNLAFRLMKDRDQAEDMLMDVFVQVPRAIQSFQGNSTLGTWLYRLTVNACLMKLRATKRHGELEEEHIDLIIEDALGKTDDVLDRNIQNSADHYDPELLELGLNSLPAETRSMLWLKDGEDLDIRDLSEIYRIPEGTIKARLSRARHYIKDFIKERICHAKQA